MENKESEKVEIKPTWGLAWGLFWRILLISLAVGGIIYLIIHATGIKPFPW